MGKKRKVDPDLDVERSMYSSFVAAANAVSQLYTQGVQQQRRSAAAASKATLVRLAVLFSSSCRPVLLVVCRSATSAALGVKSMEKCVLTRAPVLLVPVQEKVVAFVLRENEGSENISKAALLQFLQHEYEVRTSAPTQPS